MNVGCHLAVADDGRLLLARAYGCAGPWERRVNYILYVYIFSVQVSRILG